jgi:hypothetical protein
MHKEHAVLTKIAKPDNVAPLMGIVVLGPIIAAQVL